MKIFKCTKFSAMFHVLQKCELPENIKSCKDFANLITGDLVNRASNPDELHIVFNYW